MDRLDKTPEGKAMKARYKKNKKAKVKDEIKCPVCGKAFTKIQYAQAFCCGICKDEYHNARKPNRHKDGKRYYREYDATRRENSYVHGDECVFLTEQDLIAATAAYGEDDY